MTTIIALILLYTSICVIAYFNQEKGIFHPEKLPQNFKYDFIDAFEEVNLKAEDGTILNALYFSMPENENLVVYYHGNAGTLEHWGEISHLYLEYGFNLLIYDFRGFGKSGGEIKNEEQFYSDGQLVYDYAKSITAEKNLTVVGYSIGSGTASYISSQNNPKRLILKSPYYDLPSLALEKVSWLPIRLLIKYKFSNRENIENVQVPVYIFHGDLDEMIVIDHSKKLYEELDSKPEFIILPHQGHHGMNFNEIYISYLNKLGGRSK